MIPDYHRYHGCVFVRLIENRPTLVVEKMPVDIQGVYLIEKSLPLYIKFSRSRRGPWAFTFHSEHQICWDKLKKQFGAAILVLVCGSDGIVALDNKQLLAVLDDKLDDQEGITIRRKLHHMYSVTGKNGKLAHKVGRDSLIALIDRLVAVPRRGSLAAG